MKIIKDGNMSILNKEKTFHCPECGCVFTADKTEYVIDSWRNQYKYVINCPFCY